MSGPNLFLVHAPAVGVGIAATIQATASDPDTPGTWVDRCILAAEEAYAAVYRDPPFAIPATGFAGSEPQVMVGWALENEAHNAAALAFRLCMPQLTSRRRVQAFIACAAAGMNRKYIDGGEAKGMLYTAQLAIAAYPKRNEKPRQSRGK